MVGPNQNNEYQTSRRTFLKGAAAFGLVSVGSIPALSSKQTTLKIGDLKLTTISDGHLNLPATMAAPDIDAKLRAAASKKAGQSGDTVKTPLNVTLIETRTDKILVDVGSGPHFMGSAGKLAENLETAGIDPVSITKVVYTHAHPDHVWGTVNDFDELSFPNAAYYISEAEWNFWMSKDILSKLPKERHGFAVGAKRNLEAIGEKLTMVKPGKELVAGVNVIDTSGHTPGHISLEIGTGADHAVILGDALTHKVISFEHPEWKPVVDHDPDKAVNTRKGLLSKLASEQHRVIGYHLPEPGLGRVAKSGNNFKYDNLG
ncbi:MAG: MBL fold metallo-hydrolase [Hyphomicrobiaceae bacterium]